MKIPNTGDTFCTLTLKEGKLHIGRTETVRSRSGFALSDHEFTNGSNRYDAGHLYPDGKVAGLPTEAPMEMAVNCCPFIYCLTSDTQAAAEVLRAAYIEACNQVESEMQACARSLHAQAFACAAKEAAQDIN